MNASRPHITSLLGRAALGTVFAAGAIAVPFSGAVHASRSTAVVPSQLGCLPILCPTDGRGIDIDLDLDLDILGGTPAAPANPGAPAPGRPNDIVDLGAVVGLNVDLGDVAVVDATVPVDVEVGSRPRRPLAVGAATAPVVSATIADAGTVPLADIDVSGLDVGVDAVVPSRDRSSAGPAVADLSHLSCLLDLAVIDTSDVRCSGGTLVGVATGLADIDGRVGLCNASVVVFGSADRTRCGLSATDPADDPTDGATDGPANEETAGSDASSSGGPAVSTNDRSTDRGTGGTDGAGGAADRASSIRRSQNDDADDGSGLAVTGSSIVVTLALAAAVTALGAGGLLIKRRRVI